MTLVKHLPTSSCQRSFWTTPNDKVQNEDYFCLLSRLKKSFHGFWWVLARALTLSLTNLSCYLPAYLVLKILWLWSCFKIGQYFLKYHSCILRVNNLAKDFPTKLSFYSRKTGKINAFWRLAEVILGWCCKAWFQLKQWRLDWFFHQIRTNY